MALGKIAETFFGTRPAESRTIDDRLRHHDAGSVGSRRGPHLEGLEFSILEDEHKDYGKVFKLYARGRRSTRPRSKALFDDVPGVPPDEEHLPWKALIGADSLEFLNLDIDMSTIVFSDKVMEELGGMVWSSLRYSQAMRDNGLSSQAGRSCSTARTVRARTSTSIITAKEAVPRGGRSSPRSRVATGGAGPPDRSPVRACCRVRRGHRHASRHPVRPTT